MRVDRTSPAGIVGHRFDVTIVIDVLRATSTAAVLLSRGIPQLPIVARAEDLAALPTPATGPYLVFSELSSATMFERVDNSPVIASQLDLVGRSPVLVTTNGTTAACTAVAHSRRVLLASFLNLEHVARYLLQTRPERVTLVPAGSIENNESHIEDERCADAFESLLRGEQPDLDRMIADCLEAPRVQRRLDKSLEVAADIRMALTPNRLDVLIETTLGPGEAHCVATRLSHA